VEYKEDVSGFEAQEQYFEALPSQVSQDIVPQALINHFVSMTNPSQASNTDNEIAHHCAFSLPAVALTLGRKNWILLKNAYDRLASDMQVIIYIVRWTSCVTSMLTDTLVDGMNGCMNFVVRGVEKHGAQ